MPIHPVERTFRLSSLNLVPDPSEKRNKEILDCFEPKESVYQTVKYPELSLKELHARKDSLKDLAASELIHFWNNLGRAKKAAENGFLESIGYFFDSKKPEEYFDEIVPKLCDEITDRFISGREIKSGSEYLFWILNEKLTLHIISKIFKQGDRVFECYQNAKRAGLQLKRYEEVNLFLPYLFEDSHKIVERYQEAKRTGLQIDPSFAMNLFKSKDLNDIVNFFTEICGKGFECQHLFTKSDLGQNCFHQLFKDKIHPNESIAVLMLLGAACQVDVSALLEQKDLSNKKPLDYCRERLAIDMSLFNDFDIVHNIFLLKLYLKINRVDTLRIGQLYNEAYQAGLSDSMNCLRPFRPEFTSSVEYNEMLKEAGVARELYFIDGKDKAEIRHGYRLACLQLHPDKVGAAGEAKFKRLIELAEELAIR